MLIELISSHNDYFTKIYSLLKQNGMQIANIDDNCNDTDLSVVVFDHTDSSVLVRAGFRAGERKKILLVVAASESIPKDLSGFPFVFTNDDDFDNVIIAKIKLMLNIPAPNLKQISTYSDYIHWLKDDWSRIKNLSSVDFEKFVFLLFESKGYNPIFKTNYGLRDIVIKHSSWDIKWSVEFLTSFDGIPLGLGAVKKIYDVSLAKRDCFKLVITNSVFTKAAKDWASKCFPAIHLIDVDLLKTFFIESSSILPIDVNDKIYSSTIRKAIDIKSDNLISTLLRIETKTKLYSNTGAINDDLLKHRCCFVKAGTIDERLKSELEHIKASLRTKGKGKSEDIIYDVGINNLWTTHVKESKNIILVLGNNDGDRNLQLQENTLRVFFSYIDCDVKQNIYFLAEDNIPNRLSLPTFINADVHFINPKRRDWKSTIVKEICSNW